MNHTELTDAPARRDFLRLALVSLPAAGMLASCAVQGDSDTLADPELALAQAPLQGEYSDDAERRQRTRWVQLHAAYIGAENAHDLPGILRAYGSDATLALNDLSFSEAREIADVHAQLGLSSDGSGLTATQIIHDREFFTDNELLIYGRLLGNHTGQVLRFPPTFRPVELHYSAFYRFGEDGKIIAQRIVMNWGPLAGA